MIKWVSAHFDSTFLSNKRKDLDTAAELVSDELFSFKLGRFANEKVNDWQTRTTTSTVENPFQSLSFKAFCGSAEQRSCKKFILRGREIMTSHLKSQRHSDITA